MSVQIPITPETKVAELLEAYPELESVLITAAPPFKKLTNPVLRRTIARVTSLQRAAEVGGLSPRDLVTRLRKAAGLDVTGFDLEFDSSGPEPSGKPVGWVASERVRWTVDADALLDADRQPITEVQKRASALAADDLGLIRSSFRPAPLIEMLESRGLRTSVVQTEDGYETFVGLNPG